MALLKHKLHQDIHTFTELKPEEESQQSSNLIGQLLCFKLHSSHW